MHEILAAGVAIQHPLAIVVEPHDLHLKRFAAQCNAEEAWPDIIARKRTVSSTAVFNRAVVRSDSVNRYGHGAAIGEP